MLHRALGKKTILRRASKKIVWSDNPQKTERKKKQNRKNIKLRKRQLNVIHSVGKNTVRTGGAITEHRVSN